MKKITWLEIGFWVIAGLLALWLVAKLVSGISGLTANIKGPVDSILGFFSKVGDWFTTGGTLFDTGNEKTGLPFDSSQQVSLVNPDLSTTQGQADAANATLVAQYNGTLSANPPGQYAF